MWRISGVIDGGLVNALVEMVLAMAIRLLNETTVETVVQLSKEDIDKESLERKSAVKAGDIEIISGYRKGNKVPETTNVKIDFSLENLDLSELKGKATYEQIKDYVREQTGFRVSSLYISQVKRKCDLEVGEGRGYYAGTQALWSDLEEDCANEYQSIFCGFIWNYRA